MSSLKNSNGVYYTRLLFIEESNRVPIEARSIKPLFSLYGGYEDMIDCRSTFVELGDPTGYLWTKAYLNGDIRHWDKLMETNWFQAAHREWVREIELKLKVEALEKIKDISQGSTNQAFQAAKYLNKEEWKGGPGRGRPTKEEAKGELKKAMEQLSQVDQDLERMGGLSVINGGKN